MSIMSPTGPAATALAAAREVTPVGTATYRIWVTEPEAVDRVAAFRVWGEMIDAMGFEAAETPVIESTEASGVVEWWVVGRVAPVR